MKIIILTIALIVYIGGPEAAASTVRTMVFEGRVGTEGRYSGSISIMEQRNQSGELTGFKLQGFEVEGFSAQPLTQDNTTFTLGARSGNFDQFSLGIIDPSGLLPALGSVTLLEISLPISFFGEDPPPLFDPNDLFFMLESSEVSGYTIGTGINLFPPSVGVPALPNPIIGSGSAFFVSLPPSLLLFGSSILVLIVVLRAVDTKSFGVNLSF